MKTEQNAGMNQAKVTTQPVEVPGIDIEYLIRQNDRYAAYKVTYQDQPAFMKQALNERSRRNLQKQILGVRWTNQIGATMEQSPLRAPTTLLSGEDFLVTEWIDTPDLHEEALTMPERTATTFAGWMNAYDQWGKRPWSYKPHYWGSETAQQTSDDIRSRLSQYVESGLITPDLVEDGLRVFLDLFPMLEARLQDADIKPAHVYRDPTDPEGYVMIDSEWIHRTWPRFYDLGNLVSKYWVVFDDHQFANHLINQTFKAVDSTETEFISALRATCIVRGLHFHHETNVDSDNSNKGVILRAQKLIQFCMQPTSIHDWIKY